MKLLQEYVVPVCGYHIEAGQAKIEKLFGSAFFISCDGFFLTAAHVIKNLNACPKLGLCVKEKKKLKNIMAEIVQYEVVNSSIDVALGKINFETESYFTYLKLMPDCGLDVQTFGYPETALYVTPDWFGINLRLHKGYIQRKVSPDEITLLKPHANLIELNFPITVGMSGSPVYVCMPNDPTYSLLGICIGSHASELTDYEHLEVINEKEKYVEKKIKLEQYGIAQDIIDILDWNPQMLQGMSIREKLISK